MLPEGWSALISLRIATFSETLQFGYSRNLGMEKTWGIQWKSTVTLAELLPHNLWASWS